MNNNMVYLDKEAKTVNLLGALKNRDISTAEHSLNGACLNKTIADNFISIDLKKDKAFGSALLHDIGKIKMPDYVFSNHIIKSQDELKIIMQHPQFTKDILEKAGFDMDIIRAAYQHHERFDGSGYPSGLKKFQITPAARLLGIVDSFAALTEDRPYRKGVSIKKAVEILFKDKKLYDPQMLNMFLENVTLIAQITATEIQNYQTEHGL